MVPADAVPVLSSADEPGWADRRQVWVAYFLLGTLIALYAIIFGWLSLSRYWAYEMHALDMGNMSQAAWNTVHGHPFAFTNVRLPYAIEAWNTTSRLSFHVEALFPVISLVYLLYPHPESLLVLQTACLALGAIPTFWLARDVLGSVWHGVGFAAIYLLFPSLQAMNLYEFHPVSLVTPLLILAFWFAWNRRYLPFAVCAIAAMGGKEEIGLVIALFGLYILLVQRQWRVGLATMVGGTLYSLVAVLGVERHFRQPGTLTFARNRYGYLGHGIRAGIRTLLTRPSTISDVVVTRAKFGYLVYLLEPVGFIALAAPGILILAAPTLALNLLSTDAHMFSGVGDNSAEIISVVVIAAILGIDWLARTVDRWIPKRTTSTALLLYTVLAAGIDQRIHGFGPFGENFHVPAIGAHQHLADRFVGLVPDGVPVSTQDQLDPHLSSRRYLYLFRDLGEYLHYPPAHYVLLDVSAPTYPLRTWEVHAVAEHLLQSGWGVQAASDGLILMRQGVHFSHMPRAFFSYALVHGLPFSHRLQGTDRGLSLIGYQVRPVDQPNHRIPSRMYDLYLRPQHRITYDLQPVIFGFAANKLVTCQSDPLGLAWFPTSKWSAQSTYVVHMGVIEFDANHTGTMHFNVALFRMPHTRAPDACAALWKRHAKVWNLDSLNLDY